MYTLWLCPSGLGTIVIGGAPEMVVVLSEPSIHLLCDVKHGEVLIHQLKDGTWWYSPDFLCLNCGQETSWGLKSMLRSSCAIRTQLYIILFHNNRISKIWQKLVINVSTKLWCIWLFLYQVLLNLFPLAEDCTSGVWNGRTFSWVPKDVMSWDYWPTLSLQK